MAGLTSGFLRWIRVRLAPEGGFTLVELMVALGVILLALLAMAYTATIGFSDIALARQRQGATGLANQTIEQIRALPFDVLKKGLSNADLGSGSDPNITLNTCGPPTVYCYGGEQIPRGANPNVVPLVPHTQTLKVGATTYTVRAYVTNYNNITTNNTYRLSVRVSWANPARKGVSSTVQSQTIAYSGTGCLSGATHPFAAPCQPFFYGTGSVDDGHMDITGTIGGVSFNSATLSFPGWTSGMQIEQISAVQGLAQASGASITTLGPPTTSGYQQVVSTADNDPAQPGNDYTTANGNGTGSAISVSSGGAQSNTLTLTPSGGDPGASISTTSASLANPVHPCPLVGSQNDQQPCGSDTERQVNAESATLDLKKKLDLGTSTLVSMAAMPAAGTAFTNRDIQAGADGLVHSEATRSLGLVQIGSLPSNLPAGAIPAGWTGSLVQISNFTDIVTAEGGTNTAAPTVTAGGTLTYWNGAGYTSRAITAGASVNIAIPSVHVITSVGGKTLEIWLQGAPNINCAVWVQGCPKTGGTTTSSTGLSCNPPCPNTRTQASAQSNSPFMADIQYEVIYDGEIQANMTVHVDLGTMLAQNTYQPAPSGS